MVDRQIHNMAGEDSKVKLVEVDPQLFIKCRLCVENMGTYQIVPMVQQQIKYCYDINVEPFDGLPQLICKLCKVLLDEYTRHKKKFKEKQEALIFKISENEKNGAMHKQDVSQAGHQNSELGYDSANGEDSNSNSRPPLILKISNMNHRTKKTKPKNKNTSWSKGYQKRFVCNFCSERFKGKSVCIKHLDIHSSITSKYNIVFNKLCTVKLNKIDEKLNSTGECNTIMLDRGRIVQDVGHNLYHIVYLDPKRKPFDAVVNCKQSLDHDFSDDDDIPVSKRKKRILRISSRSSSETVLIDDHGSKSTTDSLIDADSQSQELPLNDNKSTPLCNTTDCINIVDSSDSDVEMSTTVSSKTSIEPIDSKVFDKLISVCKTKYIKKLEPSQVDNKHTNTVQTQSQLKHKLLSIGRKVLSKGRRYNFIGLLRYMEHTNLDVLWQTNSSKDSLVRIMPVLKNNNSENNYEASDWKDLPEITKLTPEIIENTNKPITLNSNLIVKTISHGQSQPVENSLSIIPILCADGNLIVNPIHTTDNDTCKKLLNETPVANPKQLPKKVNIHEKVTKTNGTHSIKNSAGFLHSDNNILNEESNILMPVITSTQSLANQVEIEIDKISNTSEVTRLSDKAVMEKPRIKVKPVSELMKPENVIQNNENHNNIWNVCSPDVTPSSTGILHTCFINSLVNPSDGNIMTENQSRNDSVNNSSNDHIILDTIEFPNLKTNSPFNYLKNLLSIHNINLLDSIETSAPLDPAFECLLKIKAHFKQESKTNPIVLCLSIFCSADSFCLCIKNINELVIHMDKLSAVWQWEILKIFQGEVSKKVLQNAQKSSQRNYNSTIKFLSLLKSIKCLVPLSVMNSIRQGI
ncbi:hypothetical protein ACJJTC_008099 [Scirpophaga incertulas]